jgi:hypothetical protein
MIIASSFILGVNITDNFRGSAYSGLATKFTVSGQEIFFDPLKGPIINDYDKRLNKEQFAIHVVSLIRKVDKPSVILAGWWYNEILVHLHNTGCPPHVYYRAHADETQLKRYFSMGLDIYYLPEIDRINDERYGSNFTGKYAVPFPLN